MPRTYDASMATNAMIVEFGFDRRAGDEDMKKFQGIVGTVQTWKAENVIEGFHYYAVVTGNRTARAGQFVLEMSSEQLEAIVMSKGWTDWMGDLMDTTVNVTFNRAITLERMMQLMAETSG